VLIITRSDIISSLDGIVVAPVTRTVRGIPTEVPLGEDEGLMVRCAASFDNLQRIRRTALTSKAGDIGSRFDEICEALKALADC
ncbi:MAG: hypothetical protein ACRDF8_10595, partial [Chloroflexota bacterium]